MTAARGARKSGPGEPVSALSLYRHVLGPAWERLPLPLRQFHAVTSTAVFTGRCDVERGRSLLARVIAALVRFPLAGDGQAIRVTLTADANGERWVRRIGDRSFASVLRAATGGSEGLVSERFGPVGVDMALVASAHDLRYVVRRWHVLGVQLPLRLGPRATAVESVEHGAFAFDVAISLPLAGLIVRYRGTLAP